MSRPSTTRVSSSSTLSCITVGAGAGEVSSVPTSQIAAVDDVEISKRRRSARLSMAGDMLSGIATVLGKRSRDVIDLGKMKLQTLKAEGGRSLRPRHETSKSNAASQTSFKTPRLSEPSDIEAPSTSAAAVLKEGGVSKRKVWLSEGLYVGQDRDFDPRLTESRNKIKAASREGYKKEKATLLPLPMFAGQRLLDNGRPFKLPFDVFAPLPPGQPKPEEWRKTQKNVFIGNAASIWKKNKLQEVSRCICKPETGCDEDCQNRFMFYECDDTNCKLGAEVCNNRSFENLRQRCKTGGKYNIGVEVIKTLDRGYGVRSNRTFEPNQIIVEYTGEIITQDECDERMNTRYKDNECYYLMLFDQNMIIDATRGSIARFVNHSCEPNCRMIKWTVAGKPRMALFAGDRGIMSGEELTYDYNFDPFSAKNVQKCRCGAPSCRGVLGPKPKEILKPKKETASLKSLVAGTKRKVQQVLMRDSKEGHSGVKKRRLTFPASTKVKIAKDKAGLGKRLVEPQVGARIQKTKLIEEISKESLAPLQTSVCRTRAMGQLTAAVRQASTSNKHLEGKPRVTSIRNVVTTVRGSRRAATLARMGCIRSIDEWGKTIRIVDKE